MGARGWWYEVDYENDLASELAALKERVFKSGDDFHPWKPGWHEPEEGVDEFLLEEARRAPGIEMDGLRQSMVRLKAGKRPLSIDHLYAITGVDAAGSHSILDMLGGVGAGPMQVAALEPAGYMDFFGTEHPTIDEVRAQKHELMDRRERWTGTAVVAHEGLSPSMLVFTGFSGD